MDVWRNTLAKRTNEEWIADLTSDGFTRDDAIEELRTILVRGLRHGLASKVNTYGPEFEPLVEDFAQEAILKVLNKIDSFEGRSKFTTWAHKIAVHVGLTELRRKRWKDVSLDGLLTSDDGDELSPAFMADEAPSPEFETAQAELIQKVNQIIMTELTDKQREVMVAAKINGMPMGVIAEKMGMKTNALYKVLHDGRLKLKKRMAEEGLSSEDVLAIFA